MCVSDLLPSVLASVHTCNHRACKDMYSAFGNPPTSTGARTHAHTLVGTSWLENPSAARRRTSYFHRRSHAHTDTHTDTHALFRAHRLPCGSGLGRKTQAQPRRCTPYFRRRCTCTHSRTHTRTHTLSQALPKGTREGQRRLHVFSRWRGLGPRRYPRILAMIKDTYTVSPAGADPRPRISYTPWDSWVLRLSRSCELCYFPSPGWHNHYPKVLAKRLRSGLARQNSRASASSRNRVNSRTLRTHTDTRTHTHQERQQKHQQHQQRSLLQTQCSHRTGGEPRTVGSKGAGLFNEVSFLELFHNTSQTRAQRMRCQAPSTEHEHGFACTGKNGIACLTPRRALPSTNQKKHKFANRNLDLTARVCCPAGRIQPKRVIDGQSAL